MQILGIYMVVKIQISTLNFFGYGNLEAQKGEIWI